MALCIMAQVRWQQPLKGNNRGLNAATQEYAAQKRASLVPQTVKNLPAKQETQFLSLGGEYPLEKEVVTCSSILAWRIPRTEEPGGYSPWGRKESDMTEQFPNIVT